MGIFTDLFIFIIVSLLISERPKAASRSTI
ncbi:uncharacterized protein METZ01_LOCUS172239 [marine metagenome]|uniref:Uncharacterized protein n=1 Tax=marine metagenome TaxID=408172 RepID=A0A382BZX9_9ZZZZ